MPGRSRAAKAHKISRKRRACSSESDRRPQRPDRTFQGAPSEAALDNAAATLTIGGVTLHCQGDQVTHFSTSQGRGQRQRRRSAPVKLNQPSPRDESDNDSDEALEDFVNNLMEHEEPGALAAEACLAANISLLRSHVSGMDDDVLYPGLEQANPWDDRLCGASESTSHAYDSDASDMTTGFTSDATARKPAHVLLQELQTQWPVSMPQRAGRRSKPGVRGADGGKLAPGEKARRRHEKVLAKRCARAAKSGLDMGRVSQELHDFVVTHGDLKAFSPMTPYANGSVQKMASLYGLRSSQQGSGRRRFVMVSGTRNMAIPQGPALEQLQDMLTFQKQSVAAMQPSTHCRLSSGPAGHASREPAQVPSSRRHPRQYSQPVGFVSHGVLLDDAGDVMHVLSSNMARTSLADCGAAPMDACAAPQDIPGTSDEPRPPAGHEQGGAQLQQFGEDMAVDDVQTIGLGHAGLGHAQAPESLVDDPAVQPSTAPQGLNDPAGPHLLPGPFTTKKQHRNALKKQEKARALVGQGRGGQNP
ncbi:hypothetical protein WJX73_009713 [Symbiochloris irregularis]|uniref:R3H domain-containing protein n=1 Tax=Symbiochloris irregularis TaxID=706552 RepID=A0AAW1P6G2_9CHLO